MGISRKWAVECGLFESIDIHFADFIIRQFGAFDPSLYLFALLTSHFTGRQHTALEFRVGQSLDQLFREYGVEPSGCGEVAIPKVDLDRWSKVVGVAGEVKPLIFVPEKSLLYLYRYWFYEKNVAEFIKQRSSEENSFDFSLIKSALSKLFKASGPSASYDPLNWQEVAAFTALNSPFTVISGGPGTGKTTTVAKVLALQASLNSSLQIELVAPTGKAADQLVKSIRAAKTRIPFSELGISPDTIPEEASTIQRYLGYIPGSSSFRFNQRNKKSTQLLLVDEASMVSLPLFYRLFSALTDDCRVILLGDKDQLAAVENGNVLGDITSFDSLNEFSRAFKDQYVDVAGSSMHPHELVVTDGSAKLHDSVVNLEFSYRFNQHSGIGELSRLVNLGSDDAISFLQKKGEQGFDDTRLKQLPDEVELGEAVRQFVREADGRSGFLKYLRAVNAGDALRALQLFDQARVLCAVNRGIYGVENVNQLIENTIFTGKLEKFYIGRPVIVLKNDHHLKVYNGDVGIVMRDSEGDLKIFLPDGEDSVRSISPASLPDHATAFAMSIHKSQGSEFSDVLMILPDRFSPVLTREIVYTGITRAKKNIEIWSDEKILNQALRNPVKRTSGLRQQLGIGS